MEFRQLEAYLKVYELKSFSKAAEEMFLSQPSISAYINSLENELQMQLIHRSSKEFMPTRVGRAFYEQAKKILEVRDNSVKKIKGLSDYTVGSIDILASSVPAQYILPEMLSAYHKLHPKIIFNVKQADTHEVVEGISANKSEIGFVGKKIESAKCSYENLMPEKLLLIAPPEKRFENVSQRDVACLLRDEYFIMRESGSGTRIEYEEYLQIIGIQARDLKICAYFNNTQSIIHAVAGGLGVSIVSELAAKQYVQRNMIIPIHIDAFPPRYFYLVQKKNYPISPTVEAFVDFVRDY